MKIRFIVQATILSSLCITFIYHLYVDKNGIRAHHRLCREVVEALKRQTELQEKIASLEHELREWQTDPFVKEKVAREDLLYSYTNEYVYMVPQAAT